ncbi:putative bacteriophage CI repressor protein [Vibrio coralliirubri]|uniref:phage repressor protein CI n=1 Tax=Vibrio coralliirubri TaxID=1516159 RepID=UPI0006301C59|nr:phage repressor protein CI [Vibrio coralliirubri]CDT98718.1 putative bacteriophage CI repressor protein [Vibrio coralliirubri]
MKKTKIPAFDYLKGSDFTENLKRLTNCKNFIEMAEVYDVPKTTFSTWNTHNRTSHELIVRAHLALGIPIEVLALPEEERAKLPTKKNIYDPTCGTGGILAFTEEFKTQSEPKPQHQTVVVNSFCLSGGKLLDTGEIPYPLRRINSFGLQSAELIELETNEAIMLIDKNDNDAVSGSYLISIDGRHSVNEVQRLPGKLLVELNGTTIETQDGDIEVVGKIVTETRKR